MKKNWSTCKLSVRIYVNVLNSLGNPCSLEGTAFGPHPSLRGFGRGFLRENKFQARGGFHTPAHASLARGVVVLSFPGDDVPCLLPCLSDHDPDDCEEHLASRYRDSHRVAWFLSPDPLRSFRGFAASLSFVVNPPELMRGSLLLLQVLGGFHLPA